LFKSTYDVFAESVGGVASLENQRIDSAAVINLTLKTEDLYIGHGTVNGVTINSSSNIGVGTMADSLDGKVTIAANNSSMMAVLGNQVYTGKDSFEYTIRVNGSHMPVTPGTHPGDAQIGFGFSDGTNWWVFFVKYGEQAGKSIGVGVWYSGMGGGDFVYSNALSPNKMSVNDADRTLNAEIVLTIVKNGNELVLYAGEGAGRVKLLTASTDGYQYADPNGTITSEVAEKTQVSKLGSFFDQNKEFVLCLGSFYYNADVTFEVEVK
jgi:hypothetical protein